MLFLATQFKYLIYKLRCPKAIQNMIEFHFSYWSEPSHKCKEGFFVALDSIKTKKNPTILETGTSNYGIDSSRLFDIFISRYGGNFISVDIDKNPSRNLKIFRSRRTQYCVSDSIEYLNDLNSKTNISKVDLVYLDSFDVDWANPAPAIWHGYCEFILVNKAIRVGGILFVDDTPSSLLLIDKSNRSAAAQYQQKHGSLPGKGAAIINSLEFLGHYEVLHHSYNLVARKIQ